MEIIFDLGGVLVSETSQVADAAQALGVAPDRVGRHYWQHRDAWDAGGTDASYWTAVAQGAGLEIDDDRAQQLSRHDIGLWTTLRPAAERLLAQVSAAGHRVSVLSNASASFVRAIEDATWRASVDRVFVSGDLGLVKPDPAIYAHVEQALGVAPEELHFIDDRRANVDAAAARGWQVHLWVDDADTRAWLGQLGALPG